MKKTEQQKWDDILLLYKQYLCEDHPKVKELALSYNKEVTPEARKLHDESTVIDMCTWHLQGYNWHLAESGATAICCTVPRPTDDTGAAVRNIMEYYALVQEIEEMCLIETADDIVEAKKNGKTGVIIGAQSCEFAWHPDIDAAVEAFARLGLRTMTIAYNNRSFAADGCATGTDDSVTNDGKKLIAAMEKHGIMLDLSHVGRRSSLEAMELCGKPAVFTHSNANALYPHYRNLTDEQIKKCAEHGGVIGVSLYGVISWNQREFPTIEHLIDNIAYYADLVGIDHVGLGSDSGASPGTYPHRTCYNIGKITRDTQGEKSLMYQSYEAGRGHLGYFMEGCESLANFPNITEHMLRRGFSKEDIQKVLGGNWMRVFRQWWK